MVQVFSSGRVEEKEVVIAIAQEGTMALCHLLNHRTIRAVLENMRDQIEEHNQDVSLWKMQQRRVEQQQRQYLTAFRRSVG